MLVVVTFFLYRLGPNGSAISLKLTSNNHIYYFLNNMNPLHACAKALQITTEICEHTSLTNAYFFQERRRLACPHDHRFLLPINVLQLRIKWLGHGQTNLLPSLVMFWILERWGAKCWSSLWLFLDPFVLQLCDKIKQKPNFVNSRCAKLILGPSAKRN